MTNPVTGNLRIYSPVTPTHHAAIPPAPGAEPRPMHSMRHKSLIAAMTASVLLPAAAAPGDLPPGTLREAALSAELYARGVEAEDALMVLSAARLRKALGARPAEGTGEGGAFLDWRAMLDAGRALAEGDPALAALAGDIAAEKARGVATGPIYRIAAIPPGTGAEPVELTFSGGTYAEAYVEAAPGIDLDLYVRDGLGRLVCADTGGHNVGYCGWTPVEDGSFTLEVVNGSDEPAEYTLMTN